jgi:arsenite transporter
MEFAHANLPVGVLIEVPVMLLVVSVVNRSQHWYETPAQ